MDIKQYEHLVINAANRIRCYVPTMEKGDLISYGYMGLLKAQANYKHNNGDFEKFATRCIYNSIKDGMREWKCSLNITPIDELYCDDEGLEKDFEDEKPTPLEHLTQKEKICYVWDAINRLPEQYKKVFVWLNIDCYSVNDVVALSGMKAGQIYKIQTRAMSRLREDAILRESLFG